MKSNKTVFVADDDPDDRSFISEAIHEEDTSIEIIEAEDGAELLDIIKQEDVPEPSLIVVDMNMPKMNGLETINAIKADPELSVIPAVMVSTSSDPALSRKAFQLGIADFFVKPYNFQGYREMARKLMFKYLS